MKTTLALAAIALVALAAAQTASADPVVVDHCQAVADQANACVHADANVEGDCTQSCRITVNGSVIVS